MTEVEYDADGKIVPCDADVEKVERECGPLPGNATDKERADRWRLYQATAFLRAYQSSEQKKEKTS